MTSFPFKVCDACEDLMPLEATAKICGSCADTESDLWWRMAQRAHGFAATYEPPKDTVAPLRENIVQPIVNAMHEVWLAHRYPEVKR